MVWQCEPPAGLDAAHHVSQCQQTGLGGDKTLVGVLPSLTVLERAESGGCPHTLLLIAPGPTHIVPSFTPSAPSAPEPPPAAGQAEPPARGVTCGLLLWRRTHRLRQAALQAQGRHLSVVLYCGYVPVLTGRTWWRGLGWAEVSIPLSRTPWDPLW